jgi:glycosyltransferase involved in cell wall biosynthesis
VTPTFNRRDLLPQAVDSVLGQTHHHLELIVVDDGSTDGTGSYLRSVDDPRIRIIYQHHHGSYSAVRNAGIAAARGEYVAFLDSDDVWAPDKLQRQLDALRRQSGAEWCHGAFSMIDAAGNVVPFRAGGWEPLAGDVSEAVLEREAAMPVSTLLVTRALGERLGWFDVAMDYAEDLDFVIRLAGAASAAAVPAAPIAYLRDHAGSTSARYRTMAHHWIARVFDRAIAHASTTRRRRFARRARATRISWIANNHAARGLRREAKEALRLAGIRGAMTIRWWKAVVRLVLPYPRPDASHSP